MSKAIYAGIDAVSRKVKGGYAGINGIARKLKKGYVGVEGVARLFFSGAATFAYTGNHERLDGTYTIGGADYILYRLTSSGALTIGGVVQVWMCGGGANGAKAGTTGLAGRGGWGGYVMQKSLNTGDYAVSIGSAGAATGISQNGEDLLLTGIATTTEGNSASGAPGRATNTTSIANGAKSTGGGDSTYPFGLTELEAHAAGGGGGQAAYQVNNNSLNLKCGYGAKGGTNGGDSIVVSRNSHIAYSSAGGEKGGGAGGKYTGNGAAATFYGSGGGGGGYRKIDGTMGSYYGGSGYQGVVYIAVPA